MYVLYLQYLLYICAVFGLKLTLLLRGNIGGGYGAH